MIFRTGPGPDIDDLPVLLDDAPARLAELRVDVEARTRDFLQTCQPSG